MTTRIKKTADRYVPAPNPAHEDFWDEDDVHDLQQMVADANESDESDA